MSEQRDREEPASSKKSMAQLRQMLGDANADGRYKGAEMLKALATQPPDSPLHNIARLQFGSDLTQYLVLVAEGELNHYERENPNYKQDAAKIVRTHLQAIIDSYRATVKEFNPADIKNEEERETLAAINSLSEWEIPEDIAQLAKLVVGPYVEIKPEGGEITPTSSSLPVLKNSLKRS